MKNSVRLRCGTCEGTRAAPVRAEPHPTRRKASQIQSFEEVKYRIVTWRNFSRQKLLNQNSQVDASGWLLDEIPVKIEHEPGSEARIFSHQPNFPSVTSVTSVRCFPFFARVSRTEPTVSTAVKDQE